MKKIISVLFIALLALVLIGCGDKISQEIKDINEFISSLPEEVSLDFEDTINEHLSLYLTFSKEDKALVKDYQKLFEAKNQIESLKIAPSDDQEIADIVEGLINALPTEITLESKVAIQEARSQYDLLTELQKNLVTNLNVLEFNEVRLIVLQKEFDDKEQAEIVDLAILDLPEVVKIEHQEIIEAARDAYNKLTNDQKELITKLNLLEDKEAALEEITSSSELEVKIDLLPQQITLVDEELILEIKKEIEQLSIEQIQALSNYVKYLGSFNKYQELKINSYIEEVVPKYFIDVYSFPTKDPYFGTSLKFTPLDGNLLNGGYVWHQTTEEEIEILVEYLINDEAIEKRVTSIVLSEKYAYSALDFMNQFKQPIARNYENLVFKSINYPDAIISFDSLNKKIFTNEGIVERPTKDVSVPLSITIKFPGEDAKTFVLDLKILGLLVSEMALKLEQRFKNSFGNNGLVTGDLNLPTYDEFYNVNIYWESGDTGIMSNEGIFSNPGMDNIPFSLKARIVQIDDESKVANLEFVLLAQGLPYEDQWEAVEHLLQMTYLNEVSNQKFTMLGVTNYVAYNFGYIPFFVNNESTVIVDILSASRQNRPGTIRRETVAITIHDTANAKVGANADMHNRFIKSTDSQVSWHYSVDDTDIYQHLPIDEVAWHAGTSAGNQTSIGIETCINEGVDYNQVMRNTAKLTAELLKHYNLTINDIKQHYDWSQKDCPRNMRHYNRWNEFINLVKIEYFALYNLQGVTFTWESLNPSILDHTGKVINHPGANTTVSYKVTVNILGEKRVYEFSSLLKGLTF